MQRYTSLNSVANIHDARQALMTADDLKDAGEAADYIFNKVAMMYKYPLNDLTRESERLKEIYKSVRDYRYAFMRYHHYYDPMMLSIADHFFTNDSFPEFTSKVILSQFIVRHGSEEQSLEQYERILQLVQGPGLNVNERANLIDILVRAPYRPYKLRGQELLEEIRRQEDAVTVTPFKTVYQDSQNVHDTAILESVRHTIKCLFRLISHGEMVAFDIERAYQEMLKVLKLYRQNLDKDLAHLKAANKENSTIDLSIYDKERLYDAFERVKSDFADFGDNITIFGVFRAVYIVISGEFELAAKLYQTGKNAHREAMLARLLEELCVGVEYCATGYIERIVNAIQGFGNFQEVNLADGSVIKPDELEVRISDSAQIESVLSMMLQKAIMNDENADQIIEDMHANVTRYYVFLEKTLNEASSKLVEYRSAGMDLSEFYNKLIIPAVHKYIKATDVFVYIEDKILANKKLVIHQKRMP